MVSKNGVTYCLPKIWDGDCPLRLILSYRDTCMMDRQTDGTWKPTRLPDSWWCSAAGELALSGESSSAPSRENRTSYTSDNNFIVSQCFNKPVQVATLQFGWYNCKLSLLSCYIFPVREWPKPKNQSLCKEYKIRYKTSFLLIAPNANNHRIFTA